MEAYYRRNRDRNRFGAVFDQNNRTVSAIPARPPQGLSTGAPHDWSEFDAFKRMNQRTPQPAAPAVADSAPSPAPEMDAYRRPALTQANAMQVAGAAMP